MQWSSIKGRLPGQKRRRPRRGDDRRVIRGIIDVLQPCMRWRECPEEHGTFHGGHSPLASLAAAGAVAMAV
ncbi:MAG: transposase [Candidatus Acidiferrum sp.]